jgi:hypothetical protein
MLETNVNADVVADGQMWTHKDIGKYLITKLLALKNSRYQIDNMF